MSELQVLQLTLPIMGLDGEKVETYTNYKDNRLLFWSLPNTNDSCGYCEMCYYSTVVLPGLVITSPTVSPEVTTVFICC